MEYFSGILSYMQTDKVKRDLVDYLRASVIICLTMILVRAILDMLI